MREIKKYSVDIISALFILLFVYASISKALDFETFQAQMEQSPVISTYGETISYGILFVELVIAVLIGIKQTRLLGLYGSFALMILFTIYIIIIMNFAPFTPCSCGGILEKMGWKEHLIFNFCFIILSILGIFFQEKTYLNTSIKIGVITIISIIVMTIIYQSNRYENQTNNSFQRIYLPHHATKHRQLDLKQSGFTISGLDSCYVYLSHTSAPLYLLRYDYHAHRLDTLQLKIDHKELPYRRLITHVNYPYYSIGDGTVGIIQRGNLYDLNQTETIYRNAYFKSYTSGNKFNHGIVTTDSATKSTVLGLIYKNDQNISLKINDHSLKLSTQPFENDGQLHWNKENNLFLYSYYYRNSILVLDSIMNEKYVLNTIDTISQPHIDIGYYTNTGQYKIGPRTIRVNEHTATYGHNLFIYTNRLGQYEDKINGTSIIDVYDILRKKYIKSFYLYHARDQNLSNFRIFNQYLVAIIDQEMYIYTLKNNVATQEKTEHL